MSDPLRSSFTLCNIETEDICVAFFGLQRRYEAKFGTATLSNNSDYLKRKLAGQCGVYSYVVMMLCSSWYTMAR
jgi:hypothetical protein